MAEQTPRINASYLENFTHRTVRILGKVTQLRGEEATIDAGGQINVHLNRVCYGPSISFLWSFGNITSTSLFMQEAHLTVNHAVEIIGKVQADLSVRVLTSTDFGENIDFSLADAVVDATHHHNEIFYSKE
ncbi:hypothetical protein E4T49_06042 [Aureobasidium sp. EXF-10728]|nr:hypothetical protein E4T49_06042 [Aureobasidium sp. EXF-10728]